MPSLDTPEQPVRERYPQARRDPVVDEIHGVPVPDPYRWLEQPDSDESRAWAAAQADLYVSERDTWPGRETYRARLLELLGAGMVSAPVWRGERQFFMRRSAEQEHAVLLTVDPDGTEHVLVDPMGIDRDQRDLPP